MAKFRSRPVEVEAVRWTKDLRYSEIPDWVREGTNKLAGEAGALFQWGDCVEVYTPAGLIKALPGDWIVNYGDGGLRVFRPEKFAKMFEEVPNVNRT